MEWSEFVTGLARRGFRNIGQIFSKGKCHRGESNYLLVTDGLVIYSDIPFYDQEEHYPKCTVKEISFDQFNFAWLDDLLGQNGE